MKGWRYRVDDLLHSLNIAHRRPFWWFCEYYERWVTK